MTGRFLPVTYMPCVTCQVKAVTPQATTIPRNKASRYQRLVGGRSEESSSSFSWLALLATGVSDMLPSSSLEVVDRGMGTKMLQQLEPPWAAGEPRDPAPRIGQVAEDQRL